MKYNKLRQATRRISKLEQNQLLLVKETQHKQLLGNKRLAVHWYEYVTIVQGVHNKFFLSSSQFSNRLSESLTVKIQ